MIVSKIRDTIKKDKQETKMFNYEKDKICLASIEDKQVRYTSAHPVGWSTDYLPKNAVRLGVGTILSVDGVDQRPYISQEKLEFYRY